ncbi:MAG TPA: DUF3592 domain-containing protein [Aggregatilineales bacterium]|nr:DUF3592 domain-containing protein [Aggregatilineales bacterium]
MELTEIQLAMLLGGLVGIGFVLYGLYGLFIINQSRSWSSAEGRIVSSQMMRAGKQIQSQIEYEYVVDGKLYYNSRIRLSNTAETHAQIKAKVQKYSKGASVIVYYDAKNPQNATLERNLRGWIPYIWLSFGVILTITAIILYLGQPIA